MKKLITFLLVFALLVPTAFANDENVIPVDAEARFPADGVLEIDWEDPEETDLGYFELFKSQESSTPRDESLVKGVNARKFTDEDPGEGVTFYQMCTYTILDTQACDDVIAVFTPWNTILEPLVIEFLDIEDHWAFNHIEKLRVMNGYVLWKRRICLEFQHLLL